MSLVTTREFTYLNVRVRPATVWSACSVYELVRWGYRLYRHAYNT